MSVPIKVPTGFTERTHIVSGGIKRPGFPDVGVIFTTSQDPSHDDFDTDLLLSCKILGPDDREFTIIGGYFFQRINSPIGLIVTTINVFGVALDASKGFGLQEMGSSTISQESWTHIDPDFGPFTLNERDPKAEAKGWTLIVAEALPDRESYPLSGRPIKMVGACTSLANVSSGPPENETDENITYTFTVTQEAGTAPPLAYRWDFGDGNEMVSESKTVPHTYQKLPEETRCDVTVQGIVQNGCGAVSVVLRDVVVPPCPCGQLIRIETDVIKEHPTELEIEFTAQMEDAEASNYVWDFGDGSAPGAGKTVRHMYTRSAQQEGRVFRISVTTSGPEHCASQSVRKMVPWAPSGS